MTDPAAPPFVLVTGPEGVLVERAVAGVLVAGKEADVEVIRIDPATYESGALQMHASPSLFGGAKTIVVRDLHESSDELQLDLLHGDADIAEPLLEALGDPQRELGA